MPRTARREMANQVGVVPSRDHEEKVRNSTATDFTEPVFNGSLIMTGRVQRHKLTRFQPIRNLTPQTLSRQLDDFWSGYLREFAITAEAVARRDDILSTVIPKRVKNIARHGVQVLTMAGLDAEQKVEAQKHAQVLRYFYDNASVTSAMEQNQKRGVTLLLEQMMECQGMKFSVHEILWEPSAQGITATFLHLPLYWFENRLGRLRYLRNDLDWDGQELAPGAFLVTVGQGLMEASCVAYMYKTLPLRDWLLYTEKHAMPGIIGKTKAPKGSSAWDDMKTTVESIAKDFAVVTNLEEEIGKIDFSAAGALPYEPLVGLMNKVISAMWRGADLSTLSAGNLTSGQGASLQGDESQILEQGDGILLSETLNEQIDKRVIEWAFGEGVKPLAYAKVVVPAWRDKPTEILIDRFLLEAGAPLSRADAFERLGRSVPAEDDELLKAPQQQAAAPMGGPEDALAQFAANELQHPEQAALLKSSAIAMAKAQSKVLKPLRDRLQKAAEAGTPEELANELRAIKMDLPDLLKQMNRDPVSADAMMRTLTASLFNGMAEITRARKAHAANEAIANAFFGHAGRKDERGGSVPAGEGGGANASEIRAMRARGSYNPATVEKQRIGRQMEAKVAKTIGAVDLDDNEPFDVVGNGFVLEVKTIVSGKNPKITMHPDSLERKVRYARKNKVATATVVVDKRVGEQVYFKRGVGSFRLSSMEATTMQELKAKVGELIKGKR